MSHRRPTKSIRAKNRQLGHLNRDLARAHRIARRCLIVLGVEMIVFIGLNIWKGVDVRRQVRLTDAAAAEKARYEALRAKLMRENRVTIIVNDCGDGPITPANERTDKL